MRLIAKVLAVTLAVGSVVGTEPAGAQRTVLDSLLAAHRYTIALEDGQLTGAGASWLLGALDGTQFVVIGESHNEAEIPAFTAALYDALRASSGYRYLAMENGPTAMEGIGRAAAGGGRDSADAWARRYVNALQFWSDQEVDVIARVVGAEGGGGVWGLDQEWGALHIVDRLRRIAPNEDARAVAEGVYARVESIEMERTEGTRARYISSADAVADGAALRDAFRPAPGVEADVLIGRMELSARIYGLRRGRVGYFESNELRERSMKHEFIRRYGAAQNAGDTLPRVLVKFGHVHSIDGRNQSHVLALGAFLSQFALTNGQRSFHIAVYGLNEPGRHWTLSDYADYLPIARAGRLDQWTLIDLQPIRPWVSANRIEDLNDGLRDVLLGFDAVLVIGGLSRASRERLTSRARAREGRRSHWSHVPVVAGAVAERGRVGGNLRVARTCPSPGRRRDGIVRELSPRSGTALLVQQTTSVQQGAGVCRHQTLLLR
jgi:hypothetical protein